MVRSKDAVRWAVLLAFIVSVAILFSSCPLPFEFSPRDDVAGGNATNDPANPSITAPPTCIVISQITGEELTTIDNDALLFLESTTRGAVIYYRIIDPSELADPPMPQPGADGTEVYDPSNPPSVSGHLTTFAFVAVAIGPNMYPSVLMAAEVQVVYAMAATPQFSPTPGTSSNPEVYPTDIMVSITSPEPGAEIWYTESGGPGPAPDPVPGVTGTLYTGPITVAGNGVRKSIAAVAGVDQKENSTVAHAAYEIAYPGMSIADGGDGYINIAENSGLGAPVHLTSSAPPGTMFSVGGLMNCTVSPMSGDYDGDLTLNLRAVTDGPVTVTLTLTDPDGNTIDLTASSIADLTGPSFTVFLDDGGDGYINYAEDAAGVPLSISGSGAEAGFSYSVSAANCVVTPATGVLDASGDASLVVDGVVHGAVVTATVTVTDEHGNTVSLPATSVADVLPPHDPIVTARSRGFAVPNGGALFEDNAVFRALSGGGGGGGWEYRYNAFPGGWTSWTATVDLDFPIADGVPDGATDILAVEFREYDAAGNVSAATQRSVEVDRRYGNAAISVYNSGLNKIIDLLFAYRPTGQYYHYYVHIDDGIQTHWDYTNDFGGTLFRHTITLGAILIMDVDLLYQEVDIYGNSSPAAVENHP